ncbi:MAG: hypothetical protein LC749_21045, partial [Actinobacteria bacterium]|nr:hypothetical protein [Actinomycetota bacterium]
HVLASARTYPRRADAVETVASALLAAAGGLGHRRVAAHVNRPATTVWDWLRRARANSETVRAAPTAVIYAIDSTAEPLMATTTPLGDMLEAVGRAVAAAVRRLSPVSAPGQLAVVLTRAGILAPRKQRADSGSG